MRNVLRATALAASTLASATSMTSAWATAQSSGSVTFSYTLIDLTPDDGVTPFFRVAPLAHLADFTQVSAGMGIAGRELSHFNDLSLPTAGQSLSVGDGAGDNQATGSATATTWSAAGQAAGVGLSYNGMARSASHAQPYYENVPAGPDGLPAYTGMELSANSVLVIRAVVDMHAMVSPTAVCGEQACPQGVGDSANVDVTFTIDHSSSYYDGALSSSDYNSQNFGLSGMASNAGYYTGVLNPDTGEYEIVWQPADASMLSFDDHREVNIVLTNNTPLSTYASIMTLVNAYGNTASLPVVDPGVPTVPEPSTWATMALGLMGIAAVARRRRQA